MRDEREFLLDILEAIEKIESRGVQGKEAFDRDELLQTWMIHHIQIIGEAASRLLQVAKDKHPEIPWAKIVGMRNTLVHEYFGIDFNEIWLTVERDIPILKDQIRRIVEKG